MQCVIRKVFANFYYFEILIFSEQIHHFWIETETIRVLVDNVIKKNEASCISYGNTLLFCWMHIRVMR